jgi:hypothetical protein
MDIKPYPTKSKKKKKSSGNKGRPAKIDDEARRKIEKVAALDGSVEEMAMYAGVHRATLHRYLAENEDFRYRINELRENPVLAARQRAVSGVKESYQNAMDYLKRKRKAEFGDDATLRVITPKPLLDVLHNNSDEENTRVE